MRFAMLLPVVLFVTPALHAQSWADSTARRSAALARLPVEHRIAGGRLRVVNLYKLQGEALFPRRATTHAATLERLVREVYRPYSEFWRGYLGDEAKFRAWAATQVRSARPKLAKRLDRVLVLPLDSLFSTHAEWVAQATGHQPEGTWYLVFGPGWTNMGGLGDIGMLIDFAEALPVADSLGDVLPHELTHMVFGTTPARRADPARGTVLERIVSEGVASYAAWVRSAGRMTPAQALFYSEAEWQAALEREAALRSVAGSLRDRRDRESLDSVSSRSKRLVEGTPEAGGYFVGFRIVSAYEERFGKGTWPQVLDLPLDEVVRRSGYALDPGDGG